MFPGRESTSGVLGCFLGQTASPSRPWGVCASVHAPVHAPVRSKTRPRDFVKTTWRAIIGTRMWLFPVNTHLFQVQGQSSKFNDHLFDVHTYQVQADVLFWHSGNKNTADKKNQLIQWQAPALQPGFLASVDVDHSTKGFHTARVQGDVPYQWKGKPQRCSQWLITENTLSLTIQVWDWDKNWLWIIWK